LVLARTTEGCAIATYPVPELGQYPGLADDSVAAVPTTWGIKYAGSKRHLIPAILKLAERVPAHSILDGFSGTTRVSQAFANRGYRVISNDRAIWSQVFATCYLLCGKPAKDYRTLIEHLNAVPAVDGWFTEHYGGQSDNGSAVQADGSKKPWQIHNTRKLDGIREEIEKLELKPIDKAVALTSLMLALDRVDNSLGHFASYLRRWSSRSYGMLKLEVPVLTAVTQPHQVYREDIFDLLPQLSADLAYFDPPYGSNNDKMPPSRVRYAAYYHLWTSVCLFDKPALFGKANRRVDSSDGNSPSVFEEFRRGDTGRFIAVEAIERLLSEVQTRWVILSYSSGGRATAAELNEVIRRSGKLLRGVQIDYKKNVMAGMKWTDEWLRDSDRQHYEYLFLIERI
jgi:adenine-specific DNA-methyltransferase